jgi:DNA-binding response OmpR family regulator
MAHIVVIEDERELAHLIAQTLRDAGHQVDTIHDGQVALDRLTGAARMTPDLIILDLMLPHVDGLTICRRIRQDRIVPILMLTAKSTELDKVLGLELGADDYLTKPVSLRELQARVSAALRRVEMMRVESQTREGATEVIDHDGLRIDPIGREVLVQDAEINLTAKEFDLLYLLASHPGRVFSRNYLLDRLWGDSYSGFERTVDTHIQRLRRKLGGSGSVADRIATLWGVGYKYERANSVTDRG